MALLDFLRPKYTVTRTVYLANEQIKGMTASELYNTQPALRSVISFLADNVAGLPLKCYVRKPDGSRVRDRDSVLAKTLARPNGWMTGHELIRATVSEYLLHDDAIWLTIPNSDGYTIAVIPTAWASPKTVNGLETDAIEVKTPYGGEVTLGPDDYIRFSGWSPYGSANSESRIEALKEILSEQISAWKFRNGVWRNQGRVTQWISRPADVPWGDGARDRFVKSWKAKFSGDGGTDTGGTPLLEDGMRLESIPFNAREAQWVEATRLSNEAVCSVYHLNPSHVFHTDAQTYASAKDNARALYSDTLAPLIDFLEERMVAFLVPRLGLDDTHYCEFDLSAKLQGSFEEQASVMSTAVGGPWMTRDEARERFNLPKIEGADLLIVPLNVLVGSQPSPQTTLNASPAPPAKSEPIKVKGEPEDADADEIRKIIKRFSERQARSVAPKLAKADAFPEWWDSDRWDRELSADLYPAFVRQVARRGAKAVRDAQLGGEFDSERTEAYLKAMADGKARAVNNVTYRELEGALGGELSDDALGSTVQGVFEKAATSRAETTGRSFATALAGFAIVEACRQRAGRRDVAKTWLVTSSNPRPEHAAMDGETVGYDEPFSNGAKFPGDQVLTPEESCNCMCQVEITVR